MNPVGRFCTTTTGALRSEQKVYVLSHDSKAVYSDYGTFVDDERLKPNARQFLPVGFVWKNGSHAAHHYGSRPAQWVSKSRSPATWAAGLQAVRSRSARAGIRLRQS